jgi:hypothetical protein
MSTPTASSTLSFNALQSEDSLQKEELYYYLTNSFYPINISDSGRKTDAEGKFTDASAVNRDLGHSCSGSAPRRQRKDRKLLLASAGNA